MFKTKRNKYSKQLKNKKTRKNRNTLTRSGKKGGLISNTSFGFGNIGYSKTQGARIYNPKTGKWDYQDCYAVGPIKWCKDRAP
jgi:hypothetical protein